MTQLQHTQNNCNGFYIKRQISKIDFFFQYFQRCADILSTLIKSHLFDFFLARSHGIGIAFMVVCCCYWKACECNEMYLNLLAHMQRTHKSCWEYILCEHMRAWWWVYVFRAVISLQPFYVTSVKFIGFDENVITLWAKKSNKIRFG